MKLSLYLAALLLSPFVAFGATEDFELSETSPLPECHSIGWVRANTQPPGQQRWDWKLDENQWKEAVQKKGEGKLEPVSFDLWVPGGIDYVKGIVVISGHGSGEHLYRHPEMRGIARELHLAIFKFVGNPMQRGFWPKSLLTEKLKEFGKKSKHPELNHAPLFLAGHSNGTGFSAVFAAMESARVWAWVSMRPGTTLQVMQPGAAQVPGMVMFGEDDPYLVKPSKNENFAVVEAMRRDHAALWHFVVEPKTGHGPGAKSWPLVFSFLRHTWAARVPADADPRKGPVSLAALRPESGHLGKNWDAVAGGYLTLTTAPFASFTGDKEIASWLVNAAYAADWQAFQRDGKVP
jgi:pimeloyl-ACP methyl ester carboxylesterase